MSGVAVDVDDVTRTYGETAALDGVSLSVEAGEVYGLLGPNGAGKTTLIRAITGTTDVDDGEVSVFGTAPVDLAKDRLGVLPQQFTPPERLTGRELVSYFAGLYDRSRSVDDVLETVGMVDDADTWYERLSGGQQRRICLGIALVNDPDLLVLDEPTTGIDPAGRHQVREQIATLADGGTTVVVTGHDIDEIERLADRVALLADGRVVARGSPVELVERHGGESRLLVETDAPPEAVEGYATTAVEDGLVFDGVTPSQLGDVVEDLRRQGLEYDALRWSRPTLEDVYLQVTGSAELAGAVGAGDLNRTVAVAEAGTGTAETAPQGRRTEDDANTTARGDR